MKVQILQFVERTVLLWNINEHASFVQLLTIFQNLCISSSHFFRNARVKIQNRSFVLSVPVKLR